MANNKNKNNKKNVGKICFENERSALITKIENTTGGWKFFGYMYNTAMFRTLLLELMMIIFVIPAVIIIFLASSKILGLSQNLPYSATFGLGIMPWFGLKPYVASNTVDILQNMYLWLLLGIPVITVGLSGGFAVIRDAYWTGKLRIFKSFFNGVYQTGLRFLPFVVVFACGLLGNFYLGQAMSGLAEWLSIAISVVVYCVLIVILLVGFVYLGTSTLYKESVGKGLINAIRFTFKHFFTHLITFFFMLLPIALLLFVNVSFVQSMLSILLIMFGMLYVGLIWMIHIIRSTAVYAK